MSKKQSAESKLSALSSPSSGVFRGRDAVLAGVTRQKLASLHADGVIERMLPDTYRMTAVASSSEQRLRAALAWAGESAAATGRSAGELYDLEGVHAEVPEIVVWTDRRLRSTAVRVHHGNRVALMVRRVRGIPVTGIEYTLLRVAMTADGEALEAAFEDARRRKLTSVRAMQAYLDRHGRQGRRGVAAIRALLRELDPEHASRSLLEVKTRRLLVSHGVTNFVREFPLRWNGRTYRFDFAFVAERTILETNGRRWHDDPVDYEHDSDKWSVPGHHGYRLVLATWAKVTRTPADFLHELATTRAAGVTEWLAGSPR
jgi:hypothetical protein